MMALEIQIFESLRYNSNRIFPQITCQSKIVYVPNELMLLLSKSTLTIDQAIGNWFLVV